MEVFPELTPPPSQLLFTHFKPITIGAQAVGLLIPRRSLSGWILLSIVAAFFIGGSLFWIVQLHHLLSDHISLLERIVETIQLICGLFLMVICYQNSFRVHQTFSVVLRNLNEMDVQLSSTKVHVNQSRKVIRVCSQISIHCASVLGLLISHILSNHDVTRLSFFYYLIRFVPIFSIGILVLLFVNVTDEVRVRLTALNDTLSEYFANQNQIPERYFRIVSLVYELAFEICFKWNSTFGLCNLIQIGFCVISITAKIFFIFITLNNLALAKLYDFRECYWVNKTKSLKKKLFFIFFSGLSLVNTPAGPRGLTCPALSVNERRSKV